jgi:hypothetical protein
MSNINLDFVQTNQPSFFVHFAYANVTEEMISQTLEALNLGDIREISFKPATNKKNERGNSIVVHFNQWFRNTTSDKVRQKLISGESIKINYNAKAYLQVIAFQTKVKATEAQPRTFKKPTITFDDDDDDFGPKLGPNYSEKYNTSKIRDEIPTKPRDERPRPKDDRPRPKDDRPRPKNDRPTRPINDRPKRPTTPDGPPPQSVVYKNYYIQPDTFDLNHDVSCKGVLLPQPKRTKKPINFQDSPSDSEEEDEISFVSKKKDDDLEALYADISEMNLNK